MKRLAALSILCLASPAMAQTALKPDLSGIGFLVGRWDSGTGVVPDMHGTAKGSSVITVEANGEALLRRDHTDLFDANGKSAGGFDQIMLIYPEGGTLHADYSDGQHIIHYTHATVTPGKSVTFTSAAGAGPVFQLSYELKDTTTLDIDFGMTPPGSAAFHPIATGTAKRAQ